MGFKQLKGEHQVRYDDGMTPDQTITDGAEPNSKLTAKMSVPGHLRPMQLILPAAHVRFAPKATKLQRDSGLTRRAVCGWLRVGKENLSMLAGLVGAAMCRCAAQQLNLGVGRVCPCVRRVDDFAFARNASDYAPASGVRIVQVLCRRSELQQNYYSRVGDEQSATPAGV